MAKCPVCASEVKTPFFLKTDTWRWLKCASCGVRLEPKNPRHMMSLSALLLVILSLGRMLRHQYVFVGDALIAAWVVAILVVLMRPELQVRKPLPEPQTVLNLGDEGRKKD